jgi:hypothetical protein
MDSTAQPLGGGNGKAVRPFAYKIQAGGVYTFMMRNRGSHMNKLSFKEYVALREASDPGEEKIPKNMPVEMPLPPELEAINAAFKNEKLKVIDHEIKTPKPGIPDKKIVGEKLAGLPFEVRGKLKASGNKLFVVGEPVQDYMKHFIHVASQSPEEIWEFKGKSWTLCSSAHPEIVKLILMHGIHDHVLPPGSKITEKNGCFGVKINKKQFDITSFQKQAQDAEGKPKMAYTPSMFRDFESRKTLYYGVDDKKVYDYHTLISDIEGAPKAAASKDSATSQSPVKKPESPIKPGPEAAGKGPAGKGPMPKPTAKPPMGGKPAPGKNETVSWFCM